MTKHISQREARRMRKVLRAIQQESNILGRVQERSLISSYRDLPSGLREEIRILTRARFRVEVEYDGEVVRTFAVRRRERIELP